MAAMAKYIIGVIILIIIIAGGWYFWKGMGGMSTASQSTPMTTQSSQQAVATSTYATSTFSVVYPSNFTVDDTFMNTEVNPDKPIAGVKFTIPGTMATGTNLASDSFVSVETLPHAKNCTGDIYLSANVTPQTITDNGVTYSLATSSDAAAGNMYEEDVYAISGSQPCIAVRYFIHSSNIANYDPGTVQPFDENALLSTFDSIRHSLVLSPQSSTTQ